MKKLFFIVMAIAIYSTSFSFSSISSLPKKASEVYIAIGTTGKQISLLGLSRIEVKQFENISGRHLNFLDKMGFKIAQKKLRNSINADGTIENKKLNKFLDQGDHSTGFHIGGFLLGLTVIGVILAYVLPAADDDTKRNRVRWAWRGLLAILTIGAAVYAASNVGQ